MSDKLDSTKTDSLYEMEDVLEVAEVMQLSQFEQEDQGQGSNSTQLSCRTTRRLSVSNLVRRSSYNKSSRPLKNKRRAGSATSTNRAKATRSRGFSFNAALKGVVVGSKPKERGMVRRSSKKENKVKQREEKKYTGSRSRSNSTLGQLLKQKKKREPDLKERFQSIEIQLKSVVRNLQIAIMEKDKELFLSCFAKKATVRDPVGILKEDLIERYFENFVAVFSSIEISFDDNSFVIDPERLKFYCEAKTVTQYTNGPEATRFAQPQHWHLTFDVLPDYGKISSSPLPSTGTHKLRAIAPSFDNSDSTLGSAARMRFKPGFVISEWDCFSTMNKCEKLTARTTADNMSAAGAWMKWGWTYGFGYLTEQFQKGYSVEDMPTEITTLCNALCKLDVDQFLSILSPKLKKICFQGIVLHYIERKVVGEKELEEEIVTLLKKVKKINLRRIHCVCAIQGGDKISARLVLLLGKVMIPAYLIVQLAKDKKTGRSELVKELELITNSPYTS